MKRIHVTLGRSEIELLERVGRTTGASRSELVRRAVRHTYGGLTQEERITALLETAGAWKREPATA